MSSASMMSQLLLVLLTLLAFWSASVAEGRPQADGFTSGTIVQPWGGAVPFMGGAPVYAGGYYGNWGR